MASSSKYTNVLEAWIAAIGIFFGASNLEGVISPQAVSVAEHVEPGVKVAAQAPSGESITVPIPSTDVVVNTNNSPYSSIVIICTYIGIGISIIGFKLNDWWKDFRTKSADTPQGKMEELQDQINELTASLEDRERRSKEALESMSKDLETARKANETLRTVIATQQDLIAKSVQSKPET